MASSGYKELKERVLVSEDPLSLYGECEEYVQGVLLKAISGYYGDFFKVYSSYALSLTIKYVKEGDAPAWVDISSDADQGVRMFVNPLFSMMSFESDTDIMFCVAHEVKHILFRHLLKYKYLLKDDVTQVLLNLCLDAEVNESLVCELKQSNTSGKRFSAPSNMIYLSSMTEYLSEQYDKEYLKNLYNQTRFNKGYDTIADLLYALIDVRCKELLGYSIEDILYRVKMFKTSFRAEIYKVIYGVKSFVFDIKDEPEAKKFCEAIAKYLNSVMVLLSFGDTVDEKEEAEGEGTPVEGNGNPGVVQSTMGEGVDEWVMGQILRDMEAGKGAYSGNLFSQEKGRGTAKGGGKDFELKSFKTSVPWQNYLEKFLNGKVKEKFKSKRRINRRQPFRLDISGTIKKPDMYIVVGVDESGSMSDDEIGYCLTEIENICLKYNCSVHLYRFCSYVEEYAHLPRKKIKNGELRKMYTRRHCGGTSFQPVFDAVQENKEIKLNDTILIMFTDGYGEPDVCFGKVKNRLWVVSKPKKEGAISLDDYKISCKESVKNIFPVVPVRVNM